jgi:hypothetical protein
LSGGGVRPIRYGVLRGGDQNHLFPSWCRGLVVGALLTAKRRGVANYSAATRVTITHLGQFFEGVSPPVELILEKTWRFLASFRISV